MTRIEESSDKPYHGPDDVPGVTGTGEPVVRTPCGPVRKGDDEKTGRRNPEIPQPPAIGIRYTPRYTDVD
jgi:hypothetical protein